MQSFGRMQKYWEETSAISYCSCFSRDIYVHYSYSEYKRKYLMCKFSITVSTTNISIL